ncbi:hypothetical protein ABZ208_03755 [Streptomyces sp. NPDC006208]|uniref:hypothetical protein n=1 Tax=Streptomyces sp. NPDC006208 TaxID=3156734 RepID=UPI0033B2768D
MERAPRALDAGPPHAVPHGREQEAALHPGLDHPRTVNLREDIVCRALDSWIARAFPPDRLAATITALNHAHIAASTAETLTPEQAQRDKEAAQKKIDTLPAVTRTTQQPLTADQIRAMTERLGDVTQHVHAADADMTGPLYEALGITITYENATRTATVRSRPSHPYRYSECPRADSTTNDTVVIAQGRLELQCPPSGSIASW